ncbi:hypothetical protein ACP70R_031247 [Stipagrostis hirtigluma subsp. patula]
MRLAARPYKVEDVRQNSNLGDFEMEIRLLDYFADQFNQHMGKGNDLRQSANVNL